MAICIGWSNIFLVLVIKQNHHIMYVQILKGCDFCDFHGLSIIHKVSSSKYQVDILISKNQMPQYYTYHIYVVW